MSNSWNWWDRWDSNPRRLYSLIKSQVPSTAWQRSQYVRYTTVFYLCCQLRILFVKNNDRLNQLTYQ